MNVVCEKCLVVLKESLKGQCRFSLPRIDGDGPFNPNPTCYKMVQEVITGVFYCTEKQVISMEVYVREPTKLCSMCNFAEYYSWGISANIYRCTNPESPYFNNVHSGIYTCQKWIEKVRQRE